TGLATRPLPARHLTLPTLFAPTPTPAALTDAQTPLAQRWAISRASLTAVLPAHYDAPIAMALTPPLTRTAYLAPPPSVTLPLHPPPDTIWTKQRMALLDAPPPHYQNLSTTRLW